MYCTVHVFIGKLYLVVVALHKILHKEKTYFTN